MDISSKIVKIAMNSALDSMNENMPQMQLMLSSYTEWKHPDLLKVKAVVDDISVLLQGSNLPISPETIKVIGTVALINADMDENSYKKVKKLVDDLKEMLV